MRMNRPSGCDSRGARIPRLGRHALFTPFLIAVVWLAQANFASSSAQGSVNEELDCLALTIYFEARGENDSGKRAVAHVVMNRVRHSSYPSTVCDVVRQGGERPLFRCQFTWWCDGLGDKPREARAWDNARDVARFVFWGAWEDLTNGALWYHADYVSPYWRDHLKPGPKIGRHLFYLHPAADHPTHVQTAETPGH